MLAAVARQAVVAQVILFALWVVTLLALSW
jgi:hypothetical protein